jgi:hypothetical protein
VNGVTGMEDASVRGGDDDTAAPAPAVGVAATSGIWRCGAGARGLALKQVERRVAGCPSQ